MKSTHKPFSKALAKLVLKEDLNRLVGHVYNFMEKNCVGNINACTTTGLSRRMAIPEHDIKRAVTSLFRRGRVLHTASRIEGKYGYYISEGVKDEEIDAIEEGFEEEYEELSIALEQVKSREKLLEAIDVFLEYGTKYPEDWKVLKYNVDYLLASLTLMEDVWN